MAKIIQFRPKPGAVVTVKLVVEYPQGIHKPPQSTPLRDRLTRREQQPR